jgi:peptide/nickel transport system substrate-binding protein
VRKGIICLLMFVIMIMVTGCSGSKSATNEKTPKDTLVVGLPVDLASIDPAVAMDNKAWKVSYPCYERLVQYKKTSDGKASTEVGPSLAKSWTVSPDGLTWTFNLEKGHKFADGTLVDAKAVKFSVERVMAVKKGPADYFKPVKSIETPDADTVVFKLAQPFAPFLDTMAVNAAGIVNPKVMEHEKDGDKGSNYLANHTMGSGMYELAEFNPGQDIKMVMNKNHFGKDPAIKTILFKVIKDPSAERLQLESGDLDIAAGIPMDQLDQLKSNKAIQIFESPSLLTSVVYINNQKAPLNNVKLRQAICYAVDYKGIIDGAVKGRGQQLTTPVPQGMWGRDDSIKGYSLEPDKAKVLLKEAGLESGVTLKLLYSDNQGFNETQALMLQNSLGKVGVKLELEKVAWATFRERVDKADFDLAMGTWSPDYADPQFFMTYWFDSSYFGLAGNRAFYKNDAVDTILREAEKITDQNKRIELYKKAQAMVLADAPYIFLFQTNVLTPMRSNVKGYVYNPMLDDMYNFEDMSK